MTEGSTYLGTREAADLLGVGESTVKRWVDAGLLPAERTPGRHRKIRRSDLSRVARERRLPVPCPPADVPAIADALHAALSRGDQHAALASLRQALDGGLGVAAIGDRLVCPAMARVGQCWADGQIDVYEEHRATQACLSALLALRAGLPRGDEPGKPLALGGCPEGDPSLLASLLVEMTLLEAGWAVENVGPDTPFRSLCRAVRERRPRLVWLSCSHMTCPEAFLAGCRLLHEEASRQGAALVVGGRGLTDEIRSRLGPAITRGRLADLAGEPR